MAELLFSTEELSIVCPDIIGLASNVRFYKLAWNIQQLRIFEVSQLDDIPNEVNGGDHAAYGLKHLDDQTEFILIKNKGTQGYYYKRYKNLDYLLVCTDEDHLPNNEIITTIKALDCLSLCMSLEAPNAPEDLNFIQLL
ncbi:hypothetical protein GYB22_03785 [bacterium]|nr:hypothetical protein [bacterium]